MSAYYNEIDAYADADLARWADDGAPIADPRHHLARAIEREDTRTP